MLKISSKTSSTRNQKSEIRSRACEHGRLHFSLPIVIAALCLLSASCAPTHITMEMPSYEGVPLESALSELNRITSLEAIFTIEYEKNDSSMSGDASLHLSENSLTLRIYYLGFLAGEVKEEDGVIQSKPKLDKNKSIILIDGLKNSFMWWNIKDYRVREESDQYVVRNEYREIRVSKKTLLPVQQTIALDNGDALNIFYSSPAKISAENTEPLKNPSFPEWYPSELKIELRNHNVKIHVKSYSVMQ